MEFKQYNFDLVGSTNDVAAEAQYTHGAVITAQRQSAGRGQRGNKWESMTGQNLMFTLVVEPLQIKVCEQFTISMMVSLAVVEALKSFKIQANIKWPNDIYVGDRKITGILIEHSFSTQYLAKSIAGVGINVLQTEFSPMSANPTSMALCRGTQKSVQEVLDRFCEAFQHYYTTPFANLHEQYMSALYRGDGYHAYRDQNGDFEAQIIDVDPKGGVITMETKNGSTREYYFKEVEYII